MFSLRTVLLMVTAGTLWACDTSGPDSSSLAAYRLAGGIGTTQEAATVGVDIQACFIEGPDAGSRRLESGNLSFDERGQFEFSYVAQRYPYDVTTPDSFRVVGAYARHGPILHLRPTAAGAPQWFATVGPSSAEPTTIVLGDYGPDSEIISSDGGCRHLVFVAPDAQIDRTVRGDPNPGSFDLYGLVDRTTVRRLPIIGFGRKANNSYYGGGLEFLPDGTYRFSFDRTIGNAYIADDTIRTVIVATGSYVASGSVYALDPGTGRMAFAVNMRDSLRVYRNYVSTTYWSLTLMTDADLLFYPE